MKNIPHLKTILLLLLSLCLLLPLQPALADSTASVTIGTAASSNGAWSGASPDVWTPGDSGVSTVAVSEITDRLANSGVVITVGSSITVATAVSWSSSNSLTLNAGTNISINAAINATSGALKLYYGQSTADGSGYSHSLTNGAKVNLSAGTNFFTKQGSSGSEITWTVITSLGSAGSNTGTDLQGINGNLSGYYVLGADIDASGTSTWNSNGSGGYYGFSSIGNGTTKYFSGVFDGLGHTISGLYINRGASDYVGLLGNSNGTISNLGLTNLNIAAGGYNVGGLVGWNRGTINNSYVTGSVSGSYDVGGLVGRNDGTISNSFYNIDSVSINGSHQVGLGGIYSSQYQAWLNNKSLSIANYFNVDSNGYYLIGSIQNLRDLLGFSGSSAYNFRLTSDLDLSDSALTYNWYIPILRGSLDGNSHFLSSLTVSQTHNSSTGLVGYLASGASISNLGLTNVNITGSVSVGGLVGENSGSISNTYTSGSVSGVGGSLGGLVGYNDDGAISASYSVCSVSGGSYSEYIGGLVGYNNTHGTISNSYATGSVSGNDYVGGLVGHNFSGTVGNVYATGSVSGNNYVGGLMGYLYFGTLSNSYASGSVSGSGSVGGLVGYLRYGTISNAYATGSVSGSGPVGGLVGYGFAGTISKSYAIGRVFGNGSYTVGGLVGENYGTISSSYWNMTTTGKSIFQGCGSYSYSCDATGILDVWMKTASRFSAWGTDISSTGGSSSIWRIYEGNTYPLLRSFLIPMSVTANNAAKNYDATPYSGGNGVQYAPAGYNPARVAGTLAYGGTAQGATAIGSYTITPDGLFSDQLGYDIAFISGVLNINGYWLTLGISGSGTVNSSNGSGLGYACNTATCSAVPFGSGDSVTLTATGSNATFSSWSGDYVSISNPGSITMDANKAITATFSPGAATVKIDNDSTPYYSINSALAAPTQDTVIRATATGFTENVTMQNSHTLTLKGGYSDNSFSSQTGYSSINGTLTISSGTLIVDRLVVGP